MVLLSHNKETMGIIGAQLFFIGYNSQSLHMVVIFEVAFENKNVLISLIRLMVENELSDI